MSSYWLKPLKQLSLALLLAWLLCLSVFAQQTEASVELIKQEPSKPTLDAPSLRVPPMPAYQTTVKELGYESVDDLLQQSVEMQRHVSSGAFNNNGLLANSFSDGTIKLWDIKTGQLRETLQAKSWVNSVAFNKESLLASGSVDGTVKLWDIQTGQLKQVFQTHIAVNSVTFNGNSLIASGLDDGRVNIWDVETGKLMHTWQAENSISSVTFNENGLLATALWDGSIEIRDVETASLQRILQVDGGIISVAFNQKGLIASGAEDGTVRIWEVETGRLKHTLQAQESAVNIVVFNNSGLIVGCSTDGVVSIWEVETGELKHTLKVHSNISSLVFNENTIITSGTSDGSIEAWDLRTGDMTHILQSPNAIMSVVFDEAGLVSGRSEDGTVSVWELETGQLKKIQHTPSSSSKKNSTDDATINFSKTKASKLQQALLAQNSVSSVAFNGKNLVASGAKDGTLKIWDTKDDSLLQVLIAGKYGDWVSIKTNGQVLRAELGNLLRSKSILNQGHYIIEELERDKDDDPTGKILKKQANYQTAQWSYLPFPRSQNNLLTLSLDKALINVAAAQASLFIVQLTNTSAETIFYPHILETTSIDGKLKIIPAEYEPAYPETEAIYSSSTLILAGKTIKLAARVIGNTSQPVTSGEYEIPVTVEVSGGQTKTTPLKVNYQTPDVQVLSSDFSRDTNTLNIQLKNQGTLALPKADFYLKDAEGKLNLPRQTLEGIAAQTDAPPLAFTLPKDLPQEQLDKLKLEIRPMRPPLYTEWTLPITLTVMPMHTQLGLAALALVLFGFTVFYFRRYRHPLVLELGEQPQQLRQLPLEQLPEAQQRLKQTGRLSNVLENAEVSAQTFQQALGFAQWSSEQKAQYLAERLCGSLEATPPSLPLSGEEFAPSLDKGRAGVGLDLYTLKLPNHFPLNVHRVLLYFPAVPVEDTFNELRTLPQAEGRITLIIGSDAAYQRKLLNTTQDRSNKYVAPQSKQLTELLLSPQPEPVFAKILAEQLSLQKLSPYKSTGGVKKEAIFFGRRELIAQIINRDPSNYLIVGGRQMGKSSLLKALERRYAENAQVRVYYQTLSNETLIPRLAAALDLPATESPQAFAQALEAQLKAEGKCYIFLIDEADFFIAHEQAQGYPILSVFRRLSEQGQCSFILAGFWQLYQHTVLDYQSPLRNFGEVLEVGALEQDACEQLATKPMQNLNLSYANHALVPHLISQCGQRASLIADVCDQVIKQLNASQRVIEAGDLHRVLEGRDLQKYLAGWSVGIGEAEQAYDRLVVYSTIKKDGFTLGELMQDLEEERVRFNSAELERALSRLELAFVLKKDKNRYSYCVPLFVNFMREDEVEVKRVRELKAWH